MTPTKISKLLREVGLIILFAAVVYFAVALITYSQHDPGPTHTGDGGDIRNLGGRVGAWFADFMFTAFGYTAYLLLGLVSIIGWRIHQHTFHQHRLWNRAYLYGGIVFAMLGACSLEQIYFPLHDSQSPFLAGGIIGQYSAAELVSNFGLIGATVIFIVLFITGVTLSAQVSWFSLMDWIGYRAFAFFSYCKEVLEHVEDSKEGAKVRQRRKATVREITEDLRDRKPPKIQTRANPPAESLRTKKERQANLFADADSGSLPQLSLLEAPTESHEGYSHDELESMSRLLVKKLKDFNVEIVVEAVQPGPVITRFEVEPAAGIKASQIVGLSRDLARSLSVESVRVVDNIAGKTVIGIEIPNQSREIVRLVEGLSSREYENTKSPLTMILGKDIAGNPAITDLMKMPHVLIAGTTGSGKSVCVNALILSILYKATPKQVRFIMVDPKFLELSVYDGIPHLLTPVVTDMSKASNALRWCIGEMDRRFRLMASISVRNIAAYNKKIAAAIDAGKPIEDPFYTAPSASSIDENHEDDEAMTPDILHELPYIVVIVDELADLMMVVGKKVEEIIIRIAQRARAAGIHLILATQRPSVDVVTGLIKANVPTRIAFQVSSRHDSRTVIDQMGAEQLLGQGDMLFLPPSSGFTQRLHGSFVSDEEVTSVVQHLKNSGYPPQYIDEITESDGSGDLENGHARGEGEGDADPRYDEAVQFVTESRRASISALQRALRVGYNRAARMIETMEQSGIVSESDNGKREVLAAPPP